MPRKPEEIAEAARGVEALMRSMYEGRSVRTPDEFKQDLSALHIAQEVLEQASKDRAALGEKQ